MAITRYESYGRRENERPVRLEKTEGVVVIEGRAYPAKEVVAALAQSGYAEIRTEGDALVLGRKRITPIFKSRQERALASLCHGSLAYCCPLSKRCPERDRALEVLGLTPEDYERMKMRAHHDFLEMAKGIPHSRDTWGLEEIPRRAANRPAIDTGYGSDDYRMDFDRLEESLRQSDRRHRSSTRSGWGGTKSETPLGGTILSGGKPSTADHPQIPSARNSTVMTEITGGATGASNRSAGICTLPPSENVEGLGSLFRQGELSPFIDEPKTKEKGERRGFCFSCGRTISLDTRRCPYCGAIQ
ncbi:MAG: hypothetical protein K9W43_01910 [Candidatus Thorarchaeota archaeon]|nr:hypothetical protein [Candidatus Thorarchaeota archaeon]